MEVTVLANIPSEKGAQDHKVLDDGGFDTIRCWSVTGWSGEVRHLPPEARLGILHVNFEGFLFDERWFHPFLQGVRRDETKVVITYHSSGVPPYLQGLVDLAICHTPEIHRVSIGREKLLMEHPAPCRKPRVGTFGLGRSNVEWITRACKELDYEFVNLIRVHGDWPPQEKLIDELRECDVLVFPYPPVGASVSSGAVKIALATLRPILVSDTAWFSNVPPGVVTKHPYEYEAFKSALASMLPAYDFVKERSWARAAQEMVSQYEKLLPAGRRP